MRAILLLLCACGGVQYTSNTSLGEACSDFGNAYCSKAVECGYIPSINQSDCQLFIENRCCETEGRCGARLSDPTGAADCVGTLPTALCSNIGTTTTAHIPAFCAAPFGQLF